MDEADGENHLLFLCNSLTRLWKADLLPVSAD